MNLKGKKGFNALLYILSVFGIAIMLLFFYIWVNSDMKKIEVKHAENVNLEIKTQEFFSKLVNTAGISADESKTEYAIEQFAEKDTLIKKTASKASCDKTGNYMECTMTFNPSIGEKGLWNTTLGTYIPSPPGQAMKFTLNIVAK